jgi:hypothetical protein
LAATAEAMPFVLRKKVNNSDSLPDHDVEENDIVHEVDEDRRKSAHSAILIMVLTIVKFWAQGDEDCKRDAEN